MKSRISSFLFALGLMSTCCASAHDIVLENDALRLTVGTNAIVKALVLKGNGESCVDASQEIPLFTATQDRPFNNEVKLIHPNKRTTYPATSLRYEGGKLYAYFSHGLYAARVRVQSGKGYLAFTLEDFICDHKLAYTGLHLDSPPVAVFRVMQIPVKNRTNFGNWVNACWDNRAAVGVIGTATAADVDHETRVGMHILYADLMAGIGLRGYGAALVVGTGKESFLDSMDALECDFNLPRGVKSRRCWATKEPCFNIDWDFNPKDLDEWIAYAQEGGFKLMTFRHCSITRERGSWAKYGDYDVRTDYYPNGLPDVKAMLDKIHRAGIAVGLHTLHSHIGLQSRYVTPVADPRLNKTRRFTLACALPATTNDIAEVAVLEPTTDTVMCPPCRILQFGGELLSYTSYTDKPPYKFLGVKRGAHATRVVAHECGQIGGILDISEFGTPMSCYIDQNTDLQDEVAVKLAAIYHCGFNYLYLDGSEGVNRPYNYHVANAQYRFWKLLKPEPLYGEGAAKTHFGWHMLAGANAFDVFQPPIFKEKLREFPIAQAPITAQDMTRVDFGWWFFFRPGERKSVGTQMDMWEYGTAAACAWDCAMSIDLLLGSLKKHPRTHDIFAMLKRWNTARRAQAITSAWKARIKDTSKEFHLLEPQPGVFDLVEWRQLSVAGSTENAVRAFVYEKGAQRYVVYWHVSSTGRLVLPENAGVLEAGNAKTWTTNLDEGTIRKLFNTAKIEEVKK